MEHHVLKCDELQSAVVKLPDNNAYNLLQATSVTRLDIHHKNIMADEAKKYRPHRFYNLL